MTDGSTYTEPVTPVITITDANPDTESILLDSSPFTSGTTISDSGTYSLDIQATDLAGNTSTDSVGFTLDIAPVTTGPYDSETDTEYVISTSHSISDGDSLVYDKNVRVTSSGSLNVGQGSMTIDLVGSTYNSLIVESGGKITANGIRYEDGGVIEIELLGSLSLSGVIQANSGPKKRTDAGSIAIQAAGVDIASSGKIEAESTARNGQAGSVTINLPTGDFTCQGEVSADAYGGRISGGAPNAGSINITVASGSFDNGGTITAVNRNGANGDGGPVSIEAANGFTNSGTISSDSYGGRVSGGEPDAGDMTILVTGGGFTNTGSVRAVNHCGANGDGGSLTIDATGNFSNSGTLSTETFGGRVSGGIPEAGDCAVTVTSGTFSNSWQYPCCQPQRGQRPRRGHHAHPRRKRGQCRQHLHRYLRRQGQRRNPRSRGPVDYGRNRYVLKLREPMRREPQRRKRPRRGASLSPPTGVSTLRK